MADSTVIVQHLCSVAIFICCFIGIFQERISPVAVVGYSNLATVLGWVLWDRWVGQQEAAAPRAERDRAYDEDGSNAGSTDRSRTSLEASRPSPNGTAGHGLGLAMPASDHCPTESGIRAEAPLMLDPMSSPPASGHPTGAARFANYSYYPPYGASASILSARNQQRLATAKSAGLIYCALLGLSPILKSLTKSISSDSIWAMSCWLMCINVFFFDYGGAVGTKSVGCA